MIELLMHTLYILNAFTNPRMKTPDNIKLSSEINNGEKELTVEQYIIENFKNSYNEKDRLHTETIACILNSNGYKINTIETGRLINRIGIGKYKANAILIKLEKVVMSILNRLRNSISIKVKFYFYQIYIIYVFLFFRANFCFLCK